MNYNNLTPEEERIIVHKERNGHSPASTITTKKPEPMYAGDAIQLCTVRMTSLIPIAAGPALMMNYPEL